MAFGTASIACGGRKCHRRPTLPSPLHEPALPYARSGADMPGTCILLDDILNYLFSSLHQIQQNLKYWSSLRVAKAPRSYYFMFFERGPRSFITEAYHVFSNLISVGPSKSILDSTDEFVQGHIDALLRLQLCLSAVLSKVYKECALHKDELKGPAKKSLAAMFTIVEKMFVELSVSSMKERLFENSFVPIALPKVDPSRINENELSEEVGPAIYKNLAMLDELICAQVTKHMMPTKLMRNWIPYSAGAIGLSAFSVWLYCNLEQRDLQHILEAIAQFWAKNLKKPVLSLRDELFVKQKFNRLAVIEEEFNNNELSLRRLLVAYCQKSCKGIDVQSISNEKMLEIVSRGYEETSVLPLKKLLCRIFSGSDSFWSTVAIKIQKERVDIKETLLYVFRILDANAVNIALLSALPTFGVGYGFYCIARKCLQNEGKNILEQKAMLDELVFICEIGCSVNKSALKDDEKAGLILTILDRLFHSVNHHGKCSDHWLRVRELIFNLADPLLDNGKMAVMLELLKETYDRF